MASRALLQRPVGHAMATRDTLHDLELHSAIRVFNYDDFREGKLEVSRAILGGKDIFVRTNE